ncbi:MAG: NAD(P)/FAD-dependent oxidoreductase [Balneola sp.]|nr:NAD(P)/FAD-dependent oxidoreductase [Balneola sp.]MBO6651076.1 NAD(P)/FAD-dependent oxidoreductase [Balneola sp.]MBO6712796.1 NAD(P)/FAD-dependent oxidoreductase [Balneola sp.]MBO6801095.1 NAD(P)/FAD-dependent oxidoreductase [Balneola sp.]MBO6871287.1 NAD(P)/FAD-dependent oxidoreductase [Balneola sp.]
MKVAVIGGGAAGFFSAISAKTHNPDAQVTIYERSDKLLSKVRISGGGRCNVTHHCFKIHELVKFYPRGEKPLKKAFGIFSPTDTISWFNDRGVQLKTEADGRMFPVTDSSQTIIDCLMKEVHDLGIGIKTKSVIKKIIPKEEGFLLGFKTSKTYPSVPSKEGKYFDKVVVATGGSPRPEGFNWLRELEHNIEEPVPSLFTFNMPDESVTKLMGVVAEPVSVKIMGSKLKSEGPLLITHWGMSGPAILKLSSFGARELNEMNYEFKALINWTGELSEQEIREVFNGVVEAHGKKRIHNVNPFELPGRLWEFLIEKVEVGGNMIWQNMGKKNINRMVHILMNDEYSVSGKTTFKEEFVTCGGISLQDIDIKTMQSKHVPNLYFAGEVLDIDGVTGGFNFQAAWTTGFVAGKLR